MSEEKQLFNCPSAGKDCMLIGCQHFKYGHTHPGEEKNVGCPDCVPASKDKQLEKRKGSKNQYCADDCPSLSHGAHSGYYCNKYGIRLNEAETNDYGWVSAMPCDECNGVIP